MRFRKFNLRSNAFCTAFKGRTSQCKFNGMISSFITIIVPTYKDWKRLSLCINALAAQTYPKEHFEVVIVNNDPEDSIPKELKLPENFKIITEGRPGSYAARNAALKIARGEIIGFTDSDCIPDKDWITNAVSYLAENKSCTRIAGNIIIFPKSSKPTLSEKYEMIYAFNQKKYAKRGTGVTGNLFAYRRLFDTVGFFNESYLLMEGDMEWGRAAQKAGFPIDYVENVIVKHPARNLSELITKERRKGIGRGMVERNRNNKFSTFMQLINGFRPRVAEIKYINANTRLSTLEKIEVLLLRHYLLNVYTFQKLRVQLGDKSMQA